MVFLLFFTATSGFAVQYLAWLTPWLAELDVIPVGIFVVTSSVFLLVVYNYWNLGMPWYMAIAYPWGSHQYFQVLCWLSVLLLMFDAWRRIRGNNTIANALLDRFYRMSPNARFSAVAGGIAAFLILPAALHMRRDRFGRQPAYDRDEALFTQADDYRDLAAELSRWGRVSESKTVEMQAAMLDTEARRVYNELLRLQPARLTMRTPEDYVNSSLQDYDNGDFAQCVSDARKSLEFRPDMPAAWNNVSLCSAELGDWNTAVEAAVQALRIEPESEVVRQNLAMALDGQRRAAFSSK
jgi:tetratricopeptide (TPR) repeat protein